MKILLALLLCVGLTSNAQTYTITADSSICLLYFTDGSQIRYTMELSELRYIDRFGSKLQVFDGRSSVYFRATQITNYATIAGIKTSLDSWAVQCEK